MQRPRGAPVLKTNAGRDRTLEMTLIKPQIAANLMFIKLLVFSMLLSSCDCLFNNPEEWTADQIAYRMDDTIYLMCLDTGATRKLVEPAWGQLRWSRDGQWLAYDGPDSSEERKCIYAVDSHGENKRVVTLWERNGCIEPHWDGGWNPVWSPDGDQIAFNRYVNWNTNKEIYIVSLDTSNGVKETRVTDSPSTESLYDWSPASNRLLFESSLSLDGTCDASSDLYTMNPDGSDKQRVLEMNESLGAMAFRYSPDGNRIAFIRTIGMHDICIMNADGSNITRITDNDLPEQYLSWSPDGSQLVFVTNLLGEDGHIYTIRCDGKNLKQITSGETRYSSAEWMPY